MRWGTGSGGGGTMRTLLREGVPISYQPRPEATPPPGNRRTTMSWGTSSGGGGTTRTRTSLRLSMAKTSSPSVSTRPTPRCPPRPRNTSGLDSVGIESMPRQLTAAPT